MRIRRSFLVLLLSWSFETLMGQNAPIDSARTACIQNAANLLDEAFDIMQKNYYKKDSVEWEPLFKSAKILLNESSDCESAYRAVQWCFDQLKEEHSFIMPPVKAARYNGSVNSAPANGVSKPLYGNISNELIEGDIGYINVPWISTTDKRLCVAYADTLQSHIRNFDQAGVNKWIIDLRNNTGGNCWPMLAGLGPLLGIGTLGYFVSSIENIPISYRNGMSFQGKHPRCAASDPYVLKKENKIITVLIGKNTSSAGEIVASAFNGMKGVYLFGEPTAGLTTANATYPLSDGSMLVLTVCKEADRNGNIIEGKILPDELIPSSSSRQKDPVKDAAIMFLQMQ